jgi:hypothetical protein
VQRCATLELAIHLDSSHNKDRVPYMFENSLCLCVTASSCPGVAPVAVRAPSVLDREDGAGDERGDD